MFGDFDFLALPSQQSFPFDKNLSYPEKITSLSFIKTPIIEGVLKGIKGQYLILDQDRVLNIRKHKGFILNMQL